MDALKWLWGYIKKYRWAMSSVLLINAVNVVAAFIIPVVLGLIVDDVIYGGKTSLLFFYSILAIGSVVLKEGVYLFREYVLENVAQKVIKSIRCKLYGKLQSLDCSYFDRTRKGDIMSRLTMDTESIRVLIDSTLPTIVLQIMFVVIGAVIMLTVSPILTLLLLSVAPFIGYCAYKLSTTIRKDFLNMRESGAELNTVVAENISGNRVVKAYAREDYEIEKFEEKNEGYKKAFMDHVFTLIKYFPPMHFFVSVIFVIFILAGGWLVLNETITVGQFTMVNGCLWCITGPMASVGGFINQFQQFVAGTKKIRELEDEEARVKDHDIKKRSTGLMGKIQFKNVSFSYEGDRVLKHINFTANPGDTIAIVGPTGSGKTTLINLLSRFYDPTQGTIYLDDINIKNIELKTIHQNIASAMQDVFLFSDTIANNIAYGAPDATLDDCIRVAKLANAHDFISKLPDGYDTMVGERGVGLSGGQKQRISLARALLKNPAILILDDTTSALDMETEFQIQENLKEAKRTKIIIAHRISSVKNADLILVLNQGNLVEWGNHEKLMSLGGYYKGVYEQQLGDFNESPRYHINHPAVFGEGGEL